MVVGAGHAGVGAGRPDVVRAHRDQLGQLAEARVQVRHGDPVPAAAVVVQQQRARPALRGADLADGPDVGGAGGDHVAERPVVAVDPGTLDLLPGRAVPVLDQAEEGQDVVRLVVAGRPHVVGAAGRGDAVDPGRQRARRGGRVLHLPASALVAGGRNAGRGAVLEAGRPGGTGAVGLDRTGAQAVGEGEFGPVPAGPVAGEGHRRGAGLPALPELPEAHRPRGAAVGGRARVLDVRVAGREGVHGPGPRPRTVGAAVLRAGRRGRRQQRPGQQQGGQGGASLHRFSPSLWDTWGSSTGCRSASRTRSRTCGEPTNAAI